MNASWNCFQGDEMIGDDGDTAARGAEFLGVRHWRGRSEGQRKMRMIGDEDDN